ncbi:MAG: glycosyltransferase family 39 protein [Candidatus Omnitrophica bacterium]|nr:glycosyltransferase family 39 protein [Candidatus Omnitrophota bacterium]
MGNDWFEGKRHVVSIGILMVLSYVLLMFGNNIVSLTHPDEVFYIQSAKEMMTHKSWLTPMIFDEVQFEKPFLAFALFALAIKVFGLTAFGARFWPALFGMVGVGTVYWIAWTLFKRKRLAFLAGVILSSSFIYLALSRAVLTDMIFSVLVTTTIGCFCFSYHYRKYKGEGIILYFVFAAIAVLTKGLLGILFSAAMVFIFLAYKKDFAFLKCRAMIWGLLLFLALALPWHILMYARHGSWFLEEYFYNVHWRRILASEHARLDNWYFYIMLMFVGVMPWFLFWIPAGYSIFIQFKKKMASRDKLFFLLAWIIGIYIFVQPAHSKLASYIFPAFPAIAIILAYSINGALEQAGNGENPRLFKICAYIMSVMLIGVAIGGIIAAKQYSDIILDIRPIYISAGVLACISLLIFIFNRKKMYIQMIFTYLGVTLTLLGTAYSSRAYIEPWVSCKPICDVFKTLDRSQTPVLASKFYVRGVRFYTDRPMAVIDINGKGFWSPHPIPFLNKDQMVVDFLSERPVTWAILKEGNVEDLHRILKNRPFRVEELDGIGGKHILKIEKTG